MIGTPGWYPDPSGRFEHRYHNGTAWTADVASDGHRFVDADAGHLVPASRPGGVPGPASGRGPAAQPRNVLATASMVCGIVAVTLGWLPFVAFAMVAVAGVALALGAAGLRRSRFTGTGRSFAVAGLITGGVGLGVCAVGIVLTDAFVDAVRRYDRPGAHSVELVSCRQRDGAVIAEGTITNDDAQTATFSVLVDVRSGGTPEPVGADRVIVDDVAPGATAGFVATVSRSRFSDGEPDCAITAVNGPLPFGIDIAELD